jgi:hypothetical protein
VARGDHRTARGRQGGKGDDWDIYGDESAVECWGFDEWNCDDVDVDEVRVCRLIEPEE